MNRRAADLLKEYALPLAIYAAAAVIAATQGLFVVHIPHEYWQFADLRALLDRPLQTLWYMHAQPPLLNALYWAVHTLPGNAAFWATLLFAGAGAFAVAAWYTVARDLLRSRRAACIIVLLLVANPSWWYYQSLFFYPHLLLALFGALALLVLRYGRRPTDANGAAVMLLMAAIIYLRSLWHPAVLIPLAALLALYRWQHGPAPHSARNAVRTFVLLLIAGFGMVAPWMAKNHALFGSTSFTSWTSANIRILRHNPLTDFLVSDGATYDPAFAEAYYMPEAIARFEQVPALRETTRLTPGGRRVVNAHHYAVPAMNAFAMENVRRVVTAQLILQRARLFVRLADQPAFAFPYTDQFPAGTSMRVLGGWYVAAWDRAVHGSWLRTLLAPDPERSTTWRPSVMALFVPLGLIATLVWGARRWRTPGGLLALWLAATYLWLLAMILLVDGLEANRIRWHLEPVFLIMAAIAVRMALRALRLGRLRKHRAPPPATAS